MFKVLIYSLKVPQQQHNNNKMLSYCPHYYLLVVLVVVEGGPYCVKRLSWSSPIKMFYKKNLSGLLVVVHKFVQIALSASLRTTRPIPQMLKIFSSSLNMKLIDGLHRLQQQQQQQEVQVVDHQQENSDVVETSRSGNVIISKLKAIIVSRNLFNGKDKYTTSCCLNQYQ